MRRQLVNAEFGGIWKEFVMP